MYKRVMKNRDFRQISRYISKTIHDIGNRPMCVIYRSARFIGRRQQDSHEALRHLMEGLREEHKEVKKHWVPR